jgi:hypothetical protein
MFSYLKVLIALLPGILLATDAGHVDIVDGRVTLTDGRVAIGPQGGGGSYVSASGGVETNYSEGGTNWTARKFTNSADIAFSVGGYIESFLVGGGGGGTIAGGGGGGVILSNFSVVAGTYPVVVGTGAPGQYHDEEGATYSPGGNSSFMGLIAFGGGSGGCVLSNGGGGGSGGGAGIQYVPEGLGFAGGIATNGQGFAGGASVWDDQSCTAAGGGGAGSVGQTNQINFGGNGGSGINCSFSGAVRGYAGGGGGSGYSDISLVVGTASHGGGAGAKSGNANNGESNTGGGGGGVSSDTTTGYGGNGGSGVVIIRYVRAP